MRLPASVLGSLRVGLSATALLAAGCDQADSQGVASAPAPDSQSVAGSVDVAVNALALRHSAAGSNSTTVADQDALGEEVEDLVRSAAEVRVAELSPAVSAGAAAAQGDPTAFVPFADDPRAARPIEPRPRVRAPKARQRAVPRHDRHWAAPSPASTPQPLPKWSDGGCPACGRG